MLRPALILLVAVLALVSNTASAQILNTLSGFEDRPGWQGEGSAFVNLSGGNSELQNYLATAAGQWEGDHNRVRLIGSYDFAKTDGVENRDDIKLHLRHNYHVSRLVSTLAFLQYQRNPFQDLEARDLAGAGLRFNLHEDGERRIGLGVSGMYEAEELTDGTESHTWRLSTFLDIQRDLKEYLHIAIVAWYQPRFEKFSDARASAIASLDVDLVGALALVTSGSWEYDSHPPGGIDKEDWTLRTGLRFSI